MTANLASDTNTNRPVWPAEKPLVVKFVRWRLSNLRSEEGLKPSLVETLVHDGKLWGLIEYERPNSSFVDPRRRTFVTVDLLTGNCEEVPFPNEVGWADTRFAVCAGSLFAVVGEQLHRYRFGSRTWEQIPAPITARVRLLALNDRLYVAMPDSLLEVSPDSGQVQILASSRRRPAVHKMDSLWRPDAFLCPAPDHQLGVYLDKELYTLSPSSVSWERIASLRTVRGKPLVSWGWARPFVSEAGFLLLGAADRDRLFALWNGEKELEPLLEAAPDVRGLSGSPMPTRWDWPRGLSLMDSCSLALGRSLWILCPRKVGFGRSEERVQFNDGRGATLLDFQPEFRQALCVPIQFEQDGKATDPLAGFHRGLLVPGEKGSFWIATAGGFVFTVPPLPGHWFISNESLEPRLQALRKKLQEGAPPNTPPTSAAGNPRAGRATLGRSAKPAEEALKP